MGVGGAAGESVGSGPDGQDVGDHIAVLGGDHVLGSQVVAVQGVLLLLVVAVVGWAVLCLTFTPSLTNYPLALGTNALRAKLP